MSKAPEKEPKEDDLDTTKDKSFTSPKINLLDHLRQIRSLGQNPQKKITPKPLKSEKLQEIPEISLQSPRYIKIVDGFTPDAAKNILVFTKRGLRIYEIQHKKIKIFKDSFETRSDKYFKRISFDFGTKTVWKKCVKIKKLFDEDMELVQDRGGPPFLFFKKRLIDPTIIRLNLSQNNYSIKSIEKLSNKKTMASTASLTDLAEPGLRKVFKSKVTGNYSKYGLVSVQLIKTSKYRKKSKKGFSYVHKNSFDKTISNFFLAVKSILKLRYKLLIALPLDLKTPDLWTDSFNFQFWDSSKTTMLLCSENRFHLAFWLFCLRNSKFMMKRVIQTVDVYKSALSQLSGERDECNLFQTVSKENWELRNIFYCQKNQAIFAYISTEAGVDHVIRIRNFLILRAKKEFEVDIVISLKHINYSNGRINDEIHSQNVSIEKPSSMPRYYKEFGENSILVEEQINEQKNIYHEKRTLVIIDRTTLEKNQVEGLVSHPKYNELTNRGSFRDISVHQISGSSILFSNSNFFYLYSLKTGEILSKTCHTIKIGSCYDLLGDIIVTTSKHHFTIFKTPGENTDDNFEETNSNRPSGTQTAMYYFEDLIKEINNQKVYLLDLLTSNTFRLPSGNILFLFKVRAVFRDSQFNQSRNYLIKIEIEPFEFSVLRKTIISEFFEKNDVNVKSIYMTHGFLVYLKQNPKQQEVTFIDKKSSSKKNKNMNELNLVLCCHDKLSVLDTLRIAEEVPVTDHPPASIISVVDEKIVVIFEQKKEIHLYSIDKFLIKFIKTRVIDFGIRRDFFIKKVQSTWISNPDGFCFLASIGEKTYLCKMTNLLTIEGLIRLSYSVICQALKNTKKRGLTSLANYSESQNFEFVCREDRVLVGVAVPPDFGVLEFSSNEQPFFEINFLRGVIQARMIEHAVLGKHYRICDRYSGSYVRLFEGGIERTWMG